MIESYHIASLAKHHNKKLFKSGEHALDQYIQHQANQDKKRYISATYVLTELDCNEVIGYYTLSATSIALKDLPEKIVKKLPRYPTLPATLLGRLAIDQKHQGKNLGELLLIDALQRSLDVSNKIASVAVLVESKNHSATQFYLKYGFIQFVSQSNRLFLPIATIKKLQG